MLGRFEQNARVLVKSLGAPATVIDVIQVPSCSQPVYSVVLDEAIVSNNTIVDKILCAEDMLEPLWFPTDIAEHDIIKWYGYENMVCIGRVMRVREGLLGPEYSAVSTTGDVWRVGMQNHPRKVVVETQGTEPMPKW